MTDPISEIHEPAATLVYGTPGEHEFRKADHPGITHIIVTAQGGRGGASSTGTPGQPGTSLSYLLPAERLPPVQRIVIGRGGRGAPPGGQAGEHGMMLIEVYTCGCTHDGHGGHQ